MSENSNDKKKRQFPLGIICAVLGIVALAAVVIGTIYSKGDPVYIAMYGLGGYMIIYIPLVFRFIG